MTEPVRFDPVGRVVSVCFWLLIGAVALVMAVHLVRSIWPWLLGGICVAVLVVALVQMLVWRHRRQSW